MLPQSIGKNTTTDIERTAKTEGVHMPRIIGCCVDGTTEYCTACLHEHTLTDCQEYRNRYDAEDVWGDD